LRPGRKRKLVGVICEEWKVSIRRACAALEFDRSTFHYRSRKSDQAGIEARIKAICETRVRYGYRRVHVMLQREGWNISIKRTYRIYNEMGLQLRNKNTQAPRQSEAARRPGPGNAAERRVGDGIGRFAPAFGSFTTSSLPARR